MNKNDLYRFWSKVNKQGTWTDLTNEPCWDWMASCNQDGYGHFVLDGKLVRASRLSYELAYGKIPKGLELDHTCHNPKCINPAHLEAVTHQENVIRGSMVRGPATHCKYGHLLIGDNIYIYPGTGKRGCKICQNKRSKLWQEAHKCLS